MSCWFAPLFQITLLVVSHMSTRFHTFSSSFYSSILERNSSILSSKYFLCFESRFFLAYKKSSCICDLTYFFAFLYSSLSLSKQFASRYCLALRLYTWFSRSSYSYVTQLYESKASMHSL